MTDAFPLKWPVGKPKTQHYSRRTSPFKTTPARARDELLHELKLLGAKDVVISSNVKTYMRGGQEIMYADQSAAKEDPGVALYYVWNKEQYALACDKYNTVMDNVQALMKTIDAIRGIERWGTGDMMKAAFAGFKELPSCTMSESEIWQTLGLDRKPNYFNDVIVAFKTMAKKVHPDVGGSAAAFDKLKKAYDMAETLFDN